MTDFNREVLPARSREVVLDSQHEGVSHAPESPAQITSSVERPVMVTHASASDQSKIIDATLTDRSQDDAWQSIIRRHSELSRKELVQKYLYQTKMKLRANQSDPHQGREQFNQLKKAFQALIVRF